MKKFLGNRVVAWVLLVLTVALACFLGFYRKGWFEEKKKTELLNVTKGNWVCDNAGILSSETERSVMERDNEWDSAYNTTVAVATLPKLNRWTADDYAIALGKKWGLDENALLLLLVQDGECYLAAGAGIDTKLTSQEKKDVINSVYIECNDQNYDGAVNAFLDWADEKISSANLTTTYDEFDLGSVFSQIFPLNIGCSTTPFKTIIIVIIVLVIISSLSKGGRRHASVGPRSNPVPNGPGHHGPARPVRRYASQNGPRRH